MDSTTVNLLCPAKYLLEESHEKLYQNIQLAVRFVYSVKNIFLSHIMFKGTLI